MDPAIPKHFDESTNCVAEFAKHGVELRPVSIEEDVLEAELEEMDAKGDWRTWCPIPPVPNNAWRLIAVFDTEMAHAHGGFAPFKPSTAQAALLLMARISQHSTYTRLQSKQHRGWMCNSTG